ncbi:MAG: TetR/AcrR family transcriptional regulator [Rhizobacter sp.]
MSPESTSGRRGPPPTKHIDILWAATRLFARKGVAQTSTREIAAEAATTERTLFKHFGSKEALLHAVIEQAVLPHLAPTSLEALRQVIDDFGGDFTAWHQALLEGRSGAMAKAPELSRLLLTEILRDETLLKRFASEWLPSVWEPLSGLFRRLQLEGRVARHLQPEAVARMFLSLNLGYLIARHLLAPGYAWDDPSERQAIATLFAEGTGLGAASKRSRG